MPGTLALRHLLIGIVWTQGAGLACSLLQVLGWLSIDHGGGEGEKGEGWRRDGGEGGENEKRLNASLLRSRCYLTLWMDPFLLFKTCFLPHRFALGARWLCSCWAWNWGPGAWRFSSSAVLHDVFGANCGSGPSADSPSSLDGLMACGTRNTHNAYL